MRRTTHRHQEAYFLLCYRSPGDARELIWNSRDGYALAVVAHAESGERMLLEGGAYEPDYVPSVGERVLVDLTEQRARVRAAERVERLERWRLPVPLDQLFETREAAVEGAFRSIWQPGAPAGGDGGLARATRRRA
jgi:hypothetical protein